LITHWPIKILQSVEFVVWAGYTGWRLGYCFQWGMEYTGIPECQLPARGTREEDSRRILKMPFNKAASSEEERRRHQCGKPLSDARTPYGNKLRFGAPGWSG